MLTDEQLITLHAAGRSVYSVSKEFDIPHSSLHRRFTRLGLSVAIKKKVRADPILNHQVEIIDMLGQGVSRGEIARRFGCDRSSISRLAKRCGMGSSIRKYDVDHQFFDSIDTEAKAYTLGFFTADGCNTGNSLEISVIDRDVVEKIRDHMAYNGPLYDVAANGTNSAQYKLTISSPSLCTALERLDCPPRKTFVTRFPGPHQLPGHLIVHYIRGVFDGDGCLHHSANGWHFSVAGTIELLDPMLQVIRARSGIEGGGVYRHGKVHLLKVGGNRQVHIILDWLYRDATIYMDRKHLLYGRMKAGVSN